jgi:hypothetical protein
LFNGELHSGQAFLTRREALMQSSQKECTQGVRVGLQTVERQMPHLTDVPMFKRSWRSTVCHSSSAGTESDESSFESSMAVSLLVSERVLWDGIAAAAAAAGLPPVPLDFRRRETLDMLSSVAGVATAMNLAYTGVLVGDARGRRSTNVSLVDGEKLVGVDGTSVSASTSRRDSDGFSSPR